MNILTNSSGSVRIMIRYAFFHQRIRKTIVSPSPKNPHWETSGTEPSVDLRESHLVRRC